jgi:hypothetical protein
MRDERDVWNTALYHRAIRKRIGERFRRAMTCPSPYPIGYAYPYVSSTNQRQMTSR